jgi:hypothetical protein
VEVSDTGVTFEFLGSMFEAIGFVWSDGFGSGFG